MGEAHPHSPTLSRWEAGADLLQTAPRCHTAGAADRARTCSKPDSQLAVDRARACPNPDSTAHHIGIKFVIWIGFSNFFNTLLDETRGILTNYAKHVKASSSTPKGREL